MGALDDGGGDVSTVGGSNSKCITLSMSYHSSL